MTKRSVPFGQNFGLIRGDWDRDYVGAKNGDVSRAQRSMARGRGDLTGFVMPRGGWPLQGACVVPTDAPDAELMWEAFDEPTAYPARLAMVRAICAACPVVEQCRQLGASQRHGFYGGLTPEERLARKVGDTRPHEELVAAMTALERARVEGLVERPPHGGTRRGAGWSTRRADEAAAVHAAKREETG